MWAINGGAISIDISITKDGSDWRIDVIDEDFGQPYDYQSLLDDDPEQEYAQMVKRIVDDKMLWLIEKGIVTGWKVGDYV